MKIHDDIHYVKLDKWDEFLKSYEQYGFKLNPRYILPEAVTRNVSDNAWIQINISEPCVNMWDDEDKNEQREIWMWMKDDERYFGNGSKSATTKFITDLIEVGFVEE